MMTSRTTVAFITFLVGSALVNDRLAAADPIPETIQATFTNRVWPVVTQHCLPCHGPQKQEGKLNLNEFSTVDAIIQNHGVWEAVLERMVAGEMPPSTAPNQLTETERREVVKWIRDLRDFEADRHAGDPGIVLARRLSNAEYDHTIRDLTGVDIRPTREFPVDPANQAGFDNSGESLTMSPALVKKYLAAARLVADHLVLLPDKLVFAPDVAVAETDRDKYCVQQIVQFYQRHEVDIADYLYASWQYQHRDLFGIPATTLRELATNFGQGAQSRPVPNSNEPSNASPNGAMTPPLGKRLSPGYLELVWQALTEPAALGPLADLQAEWKTLPADPSRAPDVRIECERLRDLIIKWRKELDSPIEKLHVKGNSDGSQPLILWWNRQIAARRMSYQGDGQNKSLDAARHRFCQTFPNAFSVSSRGLYADPNLGSQVRLLTAGFHLMQGYFRDDGPLYELVLDDAQRTELDSLWQNLNFVTQVPIRQYKDFLFFERAEPPSVCGGPRV